MKFAMRGCHPSLRNSPGRVKLTPRAQIIFAIYYASAGAYAVYSAFTDSGLYAYLFQLELDTIGSAEKTVTFLLTLLVLMAPLWAIANVVGRLTPSLIWASAHLSGKSEVGLQQPGLVERLNRPVKNLSWTAVLVATTIPILVGAVLFPVIYYSGLRDGQEKVYPVDLTSGIGDLPKGAKFADVKGTMEQSYRLMFKSTFNTVTVSHELFAPITGGGWTPADPIRYFVRDKSYEVAGRTEWPEAFGKKGVTQFTGAISGPLPAYVEREYRAKGLKLAASYSVIEWNHLPDHDGLSPLEDAELASGVCLLAGVGMFLMMTMAKVMVTSKRASLVGQ